MRPFPIKLLTCAALFGVVLVALALIGAERSRAAELVMFEQPGCVWCVRFDKEVAEAYANSDEGRRAPLRRLDLKSQAAPGFSLAAGVRITPTFVLVDGGREIGRMTGYPGKEFFWPELAELAKRLPTSP